MLYLFNGTILPYSLHALHLTFPHQGFQKYNGEFLLSLSLGMSHDLWLAVCSFRQVMALKPKQGFVTSYHKASSLLTENFLNFAAPAHKPFSTYF